MILSELCISFWLTIIDIVIAKVPTHARRSFPQIEREGYVPSLHWVCQDILMCKER